MASARNHPQIPPSTPMLTAKECAEYLRISIATIYRLLKDRQLPAFKVGREWRFNVEMIDEWRLRSRNHSNLR
jgi:excisionase family DNA binding protein